jgi:thiamine biosynthesis lipoprotein ApbE
MISCGNSTVRVVSTNDQKINWPLTFSNPSDGSIVKEFGFQEGSLNSSGIIKGDHIINPKTLKPVDNSRVSVWVRSDDATIGDALSTSFMLLDSCEIEKICKGDGTVSCMILKADENIEIYGSFFTS